MAYLLKNIFSIKAFASLVIIIFIFGFFPGRQANAISITGVPAAANIGPTSADINWGTDENGDSTVYYTATSGPSWHLQNKVTSMYLLDVDFININEGWAVGPNGTIIHTTDGGKNWSLQSSGVTQEINEIIALNANNIWAVSRYNILHSTNAGSTWTSVYNNGAKILYGLHTVDGVNIWASGANGAIIHTNNGGTSWEDLNSGVSDIFYDINGVGNRLWAAGFNGAIIYSNNSGVTWSQQFSGTSQPINSICLVDQNNIWLAGGTGTILRTSNGGLNWSAQSSGTSQTLMDMAYQEGNLVAVGHTGVTLTSDNYGTTWQAMSHPSLTFFNGIDFVNRNSFYAAGDQMYYYGIVYGSFKYDATLTTSHSISLSNVLTPATQYYYYVCSQNIAGEEVCSNDYTFTTLGVCPDGTLAGNCNGTQYCDPGLSPPNLVYNCTKCGYICLAPNIYCNLGSGSCEQGCDINTPVGGCNAATKQYCQSAGTFVNDCRQCGYTCLAPNIYCNLGSGSCEQGCDINTPVGGCVGSQYCQSPGTLVNNCDKCLFSCPASDPYCDKNSASPTYGQCQKKCTDGTSGPGCNTATKQYCDAAFVLHTDCETNIAQCGFACPPPAPYCSPATHQCVNTHCADGTPLNSCNGNRVCTPALILEQWCNFCGYICPSAAPFCDKTSHQCDANKCADGTPLNGCNASQQWCNNVTKVLEYNCQKPCGYTCPAATPHCSAAGQCLPACSDGTNFGQCNASFQYCCKLTGDSFCAPGQLSPTTGHNCGANECKFDCSTTPAEPYCDAAGTHACAEQCIDGTVRGGCSAAKQYCNAALQLVNDCRQCGYACADPTPQCNDLTGACEADTIPPQISNVEITDITFNSAILKFLTSEPTQANIIIYEDANCSTVYKGIGLFEYYSSFNVLMSGLLPSTTYYLDIGVYDQADNFNSIGCPAKYSFKTHAEPDTTPPVAQIITPAEDENITSRFYDITLSASDNVVVSYIDLTLNNEPLARLTSESEFYEYNLDVSQHLPGPYRLEAIATDSSNNIASSGLRPFRISYDAVAPKITEIKSDVGYDEATKSHRAVITWQTDEPATSRVDYVIENDNGSYDTTYGNDTACANLILPDCVKDGALATSHTIELKNLEANRRYHYRLTSCDQSGNCSH